MKKLTRFCSIFLVLVGMGRVMSAQAQNSTTLTLTNALDAPICAVYFAPNTAADWGENRLDDRETMMAGALRQWQIAPNTYNLQVQTCSGDVFEIDGIAVTTDYRWDVVSHADLIAQAQQLNQQGQEADSQGHYNEAIGYYQQAAALLGDIFDLRDQAGILNNIGSSYDSLSNYPLALDFYQRALALHQSVYDRVGAVPTLNNIGAVYQSTGQYDQALGFYSQALAVAREINNPTWQGRTLVNMGMAYQSQGEYAQALDFFQQGAAALHDAPDAAGEGTALNNIGLLYWAQGDYVRALDFYHQAQAVWRDTVDPANQETVLNNMGAAYQAAGQSAQALVMFQQALDLAIQLPDLFSQETALNNLGQVYQSQENYAQALDKYQRALALERQIVDTAGEAVTLTNIGSVYHDQQQLDQALDNYQQALPIQQQLHDLPGQATTLNNMAMVYLDQNQPNQAIAGFEQAVDIKESILKAASLEQAITSLARSDETVNIYSRLVGLLITQRDVLGALDYAERGRAILIRDELRSGLIDFRANLEDQNLLQQEKRLQQAAADTRTRLDALTQDATSAPQDIQAGQDALDAARSAYDNYLQQMQLQGGYLARNLTLKVASLQEIHNALPPDTTLILYGVNNENAYVLLITANTITAQFPVTTAMPAVRNALANFAANRHSNVPLQDLYRLIFASIAPLITTKHLIISADGVLSDVPFAALQDPATNRYLIDDYSISMIPSATALVLLSQRPHGSPTSPDLVLAQARAPGLLALMHADSEANAVAQMLGVKAITNATETDLRQNSSGAAVIHISAHAQLNPTAPLYSAIDLGADPNNDGRFEAREIYQLNLSQGAPLVILSGCDTGSGDSGEDFGALSRAFLVAGAQKVVASLWSVDDAATAQLLTTFYSARSTAGSDAEALQTAMLQTRKTYSDPYFWAAFTLVGLP